MTTAILTLSLLARLVCCSLPTAKAEGFVGCLPSGVDLKSKVATEAARPTSKMMARRITVKQRLIQLKAYCKRGKLVDGKGKEIYFYPLIGCWGNPPNNYLDLLRHQEQEIQRLKKRYAVIQIPCAQSVDPRSISQYSPR